MVWFFEFVNIRATSLAVHAKCWKPFHRLGLFDGSSSLCLSFGSFILYFFDIFVWLAFASRMMRWKWLFFICTRISKLSASLELGPTGIVLSHRTINRFIVVYGPRGHITQVRADSYPQSWHQVAHRAFLALRFWSFYPLITQARPRGHKSRCFDSIELLSTLDKTEMWAKLLHVSTYPVLMHQIF